MPSIDISDSTIRRWGQTHLGDVGSRGPLPRSLVMQFAAYQEMTTEQKLLRAEQRIRELEAERSEDKAIIRGLQREIADLRAELAEWKDRAANLAGVVHSDD